MSKFSFVTQASVRLCRILTFFAATCLTAAQAQEVDKVEVKAEQVAPNLYLLQTGTAANIAALVGDDGIVLIDASLVELQEKIKRALRTVSDKPVRYLINTHYHGDHTTGNVAFSGATIIAHRNVRARLEKGGSGGNFASFRFDYTPLAKAGLPTVTVDKDLELHINGETLRVLHYPKAHSDGDLIVYFPKANVVHMGDLFTTYGFPDVDIAGGATVAGWVAALQDVIDKLPADVKVIPGHGPISTLKDVRELMVMLKDTTAVVRRGIAQKKTLPELKNEKVLAPWQSWARYFSHDAYLEMLYNDLTDKETWDR